MAFSIHIKVLTSYYLEIKGDCKIRIQLLVDINENEWNQLMEYIIQWHLTIEEELKRIGKYKNRYY